MGSASDDVAARVMAKWTAAFSKLDADSLSSLYSRHALFFGSNPNLYRGKDGVAAYFRGLPRWQSQSVRFSEVVTEQVNADLVNFAGIANFAFDGAAISVKMTWVIGREDFDWKIVSHHASSKAPLI
jgi:ketosteroid isomerase-like protein